MNIKARERLPKKMFSSVYFDLFQPLDKLCFEKAISFNRSENTKHVCTITIIIVILKRLSLKALSAIQKQHEGGGETG